MAVKKKTKKSNQATATLSSQDKEWRAQDDARTLSQAAAIKKDKARLKLAKEAAKPMVEERTAELQGLRNVANLKV